MTKKLVVGAIGILSLISWQASILEKTSYTVTRVIDGDTFETAEKQKIRLSGIQAPEVGLCGSEEAKDALEKLILNKKVNLKVIYRDQYLRDISLVYYDNKFVSEEMLKSGWVYVLNTSKESAAELAATAKIIKDRKLGIFSSKCTQDTNPINPKCNIKGNKRQGSESSIYHYPGCGQYNNTQVQLYLGDQWFCTKAEAEQAGFQKAQLCK